MVAGSGCGLSHRYPLAGYLLNLNGLPYEALRKAMLYDSTAPDANWQ